MQIVIVTSSVQTRNVTPGVIVKLTVHLNNIVMEMSARCHVKMTLISVQTPVFAMNTSVCQLAVQVKITLH